MHFAHPQYLFYGLAALFFLGTGMAISEWYYGKLCARFADKDILEKIVVARLGSGRKWQQAFILLSAGLAFISLSCPQWGSYWKDRSSSGLDILIALDASKSMYVKDVNPDRFLAARDEAERFVTSLESDNVGLMVFAGDAFLSCPFTMDHNGFTLILRNTNAGSTDKGGTSFDNLILEAARAFDDSKSHDRILIVLSDGDDTENSTDKAAENAKNKNIRVYAAGFGTGKGGIISYVDGSGKAVTIKDKSGSNVISCLNAANLKKLADSSGGALISDPAGAHPLDRLYPDHLSKIKKHKIDESVRKAYIERFQIPLFFAVIFLIVSVIVPLTGKHENKM